MKIVDAEHLREGVNAVIKEMAAEVKSVEVLKHLVMLKQTLNAAIDITPCIDIDGLRPIARSRWVIVTANGENIVAKCDACETKIQSRKGLGGIYRHNFCPCCGATMNEKE